MNYRIPPDKEAFADVTRDWRPDLLATLKRVIQARFGDDTISTSSIVEAMQNLRFWPLDAVTRTVLIELGDANLNSTGELQDRLNKLRRYSFYVLAAGADRDFKCISMLSARDGAALIRGLAIAEDCGYSRYRGSVSMVNRAFAVFRQIHPLPIWAELADWIIVHTTNSYVPFNFRRTRYQWEDCRQGSSAPEETWRRVSEAESRRQRGKAESVKRQQREAQDRVHERQQRRQRSAQISQARSLERTRLCAELNMLSPLQRFEHICADNSRPLGFYPPEFAAIDDATIAAMPESLRAALLHRIGNRRKGPWRQLLQQLGNAPSKP
jgi:hypothetical protein